MTQKRLKCFPINFLLALRDNEDLDVVLETRRKRALCRTEFFTGRAALQLNLHDKRFAFA